jgi:hypothetical protein
MQVFLLHERSQEIYDNLLLSPALAKEGTKQNGAQVKDLCPARIAASPSGDALDHDTQAAIVAFT